MILLATLIKFFASPTVVSSLFTIDSHRLTDKCYDLNRLVLDPRAVASKSRLTTFGDPCKGVAKSLAVEASCR